MGLSLTKIRIRQPLSLTAYSIARHTEWWQVKAWIRLQAKCRAMRRESEAPVVAAARESGKPHIPYARPAISASTEPGTRAIIAMLVNRKNTTRPHYPIPLSHVCSFQRPATEEVNKKQPDTTNISMSSAAHANFFRR